MAAVASFLIFSGLAAQAIARRAAVRDKRVVRIRRQWLRSLFVEDLTPFGLVYRVTTVSDEEGKAHVRLYAFDIGQVFSRRNSMLRQLSGGVWRDA
ncbi:hypothetical protein BH11PSE2_BH11PSE2_06840 [soil metagenome]